MMQEQIRQLERCALEAWPAAETETCDGWIFRFAHGVTGRANSVWPNESSGRLSVNAKIAAAEAFYTNRRQPSRFQVNPHSEPNDLAERLTKHGYTPTKPTHVQTTTVSSLLDIDFSPHTALSLELDRALSNEWLRYYQTANQIDDKTIGVRADILRRIADPAAFVSARQNGRIAGVGLGVCAYRWLCISNMHVAAEARRAGIATAILHKIAHWARQQACKNAFLQVMTNNQPALALYRKLGFRPQYTYRYFEK